jgi:Transposase DDE domain
MRRIRFKEPESGKTLVFRTNHFTRSAAIVCALYKSRWQVGLLFKWIKQHLRIKQFLGASENAVKSQIWIAVSVYVLVAIVKKRLTLDAPLYTLLRILSLTLFEKMPLQQASLGNDHISGTESHRQPTGSIRLLRGHYWCKLFDTTGLAPTAPTDRPAYRSPKRCPGTAAAAPGDGQALELFSESLRQNESVEQEIPLPAV